MRADVRIDSNGRSDEMGQSIIRFGKIARADKDTELHVYERDGEDWARVTREFVGGVKSKKFNFTHGQLYIVVVIGDKIAGVASTAPQKLVAPFNVFMNPPEDHSKDFLRVDVPTNVPIEGDLKRSIVAALRDK